MHLPSHVRKHEALIPLWILLLFVVIHVGGCSGDSASEPQNTAPTGCFNVMPDSVGTSVPFLVDAACSTDDQDSISMLLVRWDWENDGIWDTQWSTVKTASHAFSTAGTKTVKLEVKDTGSLTDDFLGGVTVTADATPPSNVLILEDAFNPSWSPDGTALVCNRPPAGSYDDDDIEIWRVRDDGADPQMLVEDSIGSFFPVWLPDGEHIVYLRAYSGAEEFVVYDLEGGPPLIWPVEGVWDDPGFALTPDGGEILYTVWGPTSTETWALDLSTGAMRFVWTGSGGRISPDGEWIAFINAGDSLTVAPMGGGPARTYEGGWHACWTPDNRFILFTGWSGSGTRDLIMVERDGSGRWELTNDSESEALPVVSPDGQQLAYHRSLPGEKPPLTLWILDLENRTHAEAMTWGGVKQLLR